MDIILDNNFIYIKNIPTNELVEVRNRFTFMDYSQCITNGRFDKKRAKRVSFVSNRKSYILIRSGFIKKFFSLVKSNNFEVDSIEDKRIKLLFSQKDYTDEEIKSYLPDFDYVEHQVRALKSLLKTNNGIIKSTTSSGKGDMILSLLKITNVKTLVIVGKITLAEQLRNRFVKGGIDCGLLTSKKKDTDHKVVMATIGSLKNFDEKVECIIVDEVHNAAAATYQEFLSRTPSLYRWGFSATPDYRDKLNLAKISQFFGPIVEEISASELLENDVITKPKIYFVKNRVEPTTDWVSAFNNCIAFNKDRNELIAKIVKEKNLPTLILVRSIEHGNILQEMMPNSVFVSGKNSTAERNDIIERFEKMEIKTVISSNIFNEGVSINIIRVLINASGGKSGVENYQKLGRALRKDLGKEYAEVYDFTDTGNRFTQKHSKERKDVYIRAGFEVENEKLIM